MEQRRAGLPRRPYTLALIPAWNVVARFLVLWLVATLVSALAAKLAEERRLSRTDALTGVRNGRAFREPGQAAG
jgi:hypothetical protein